MFSFPILVAFLFLFLCIGLICYIPQSWQADQMYHVSCGAQWGSLSCHLTQMLQDCPLCGSCVEPCCSSVLLAHLWVGLTLRLILCEDLPLPQIWAAVWGLTPESRIRPSRFRFLSRPPFWCTSCGYNWSCSVMIWSWPLCMLVWASWKELLCRPTSATDFLSMFGRSYKLCDLWLPELDLELCGRCHVAIWGLPPQIPGMGQLNKNAWNHNAFHCSSAVHVLAAERAFMVQVVLKLGGAGSHESPAWGE